MITVGSVLPDNKESNKICLVNAVKRDRQDLWRDRNTNTFSRNKNHNQLTKQQMKQSLLVRFSVASKED